jgi:transcription antitermination factor NusG
LSKETLYPWYALNIFPRHEKKVAAALDRKGYEAYLPVYCGRHRSAGRFQDVWLPLFPGYVFCRFDVQCRLPILQTSGVLSIVGIGRTPMPADDSEIEAVRRLEEPSWGLKPRPWPFLRVGNRVQVVEGPLRGLEGVLIDEVKDSRFVVSLNLLQRAVAVPIDRRWVRPAETPAVQSA